MIAGLHMFKKIGGFISFLAAVICIGVAILWVRGRNHADVLLIRTPGHHAAGAASIRNGLLVAVSDLPYDCHVSVDMAEQAVAILDQTPDEFAPIRDKLFDKQTTVKFSLLGLQTARGEIVLTTTLTTHFSAAIIPDWLIVLITGTIFVVLVWRSIWIPRRRRRNGLCLACGYDIRASAGRCPECGKAIPVPAVPQAPAAS
jgi:hypothetical protein